MKYFFLTVITISFFIFYSCSGDNKYKITPCCDNSQQENDTTDTTLTKQNLPSNENIIKNIKIYLETSGSIKGYVNFPDDVKGNLTMKDLPLLFTDLENKICDNVSLYTFSEKIIPYKKTTKEFGNQLIHGEIFTNGDSKIQTSICEIIDSLKKGEIGFFISDCIVDLGGKTINDLPIVTSEISDVIQKKNISSIVYMYKSDFNGKFYYTCKRSNRQPFKKEIMHNRPFYVWVFGNKENLKELLKKNIFSEDVENSYTYNIDYNCCDINYQIIPYKIKGQILTTEYNEVLEFKKFRDNKITFTIGLDLGSLPQYAITKEYLKQNISFSPEFIDIEIDTILTIDEMKKDKAYSKVAPKINPNFNLTHFVVITIKNNNNNIAVDYLLKINRNNPTWIDATNIDNDSNISIDSIEGKTFSLKSITDAFDRNSKDNTTLIELPFYIKNR